MMCIVSAMEVSAFLLRHSSVHRNVYAIFQNLQFTREFILHAIQQLSVHVDMQSFSSTDQARLSMSLIRILGLYIFSCFVF